MSSSFNLFRWLGQQGAVYLACAMNLLVGATAVGYHLRSRRAAVARAKQPPPPGPGDTSNDSGDAARGEATNPPFHRGIHTESGMSMALLHSVRNFLKPRGQLLMVVNRHLPYRQWLQALFGHCDTIAENNRYRVYRARNTR